ncbi:MarR family transcriptional regulator [Sphingomonas suaedae]|uniref:MarR family transcriptional regulator n=2 Tax=Sphingomonas suaedae TaxID=2599297 RepID=A0A518RLI8_9SPHN|nr:MarR family transcriptional regulator [Sphingomonas suaedae]
MISDDIHRSTQSQAREAGPIASALALLAHEPGLSIRTLAAGVSLSHAGAVRLVDRLVAEGLVERRAHSSDGRTRSLYLTRSGAAASVEVLAARDRVIADGLSVLSDAELELLGALSQKVVRARLLGLEHAYQICRLCCEAACIECPISAELRQRARQQQ